MTTVPLELRGELERAGEQPVRLADPETHVEYVVLKAEVYDRIRARADAESIDPSFYEYGEFRPLEK